VYTIKHTPSQMLSLVLAYHKLTMQWFIVATLLSSLAITQATYGPSRHGWYSRYKYRCFWPWKCYKITSPMCGEDSDCDSSNYCDQYSKQCKQCKSMSGLCRRDENCCEGTVCECGCCQAPKKPGSEGAQCGSDADCNAGMCCASDQCGTKTRFVCKKLRSLGETCVMDGLEPRHQNKCPCDRGLRCEKNQ
jgi:hypothetical protein